MFFNINKYLEYMINNSNRYQEYMFINITGWPQKVITKLVGSYARMFLIVGGRIHHSWIGRKEVLHASLLHASYYMHHYYMHHYYMHHLFAKLSMTLNSFFADEYWTKQNFGVTWARNAQQRHCAKAWRCASNARRAITQFQELGHTGDRPRSGRKRTINTTRNRQRIINKSNEIRQCLCEKLLVNPVSRENRSSESR